MKKYIAAVGFTGELLTKKEFIKWKKERKEKDIKKVGEVDFVIGKVPWYMYFPEPTLSPLFKMFSLRNKPVGLRQKA